MRTIFVLFDSLNRLAIGAYGGKSIATANFDRFASRAVTYDKHYVGSLPCMPARRDMHTGRLNFMHRPWGPLEPFDNSYARLLSNNGIYTHLVSDHLHYFETGGWGYASAFDSWDFIKGQEYDALEVMTRPPIDRLRARFNDRHYPMHEFTEGQTITRGNSSKDAWRRSRHAINTEFMQSEEQFPTAKCFTRAFDFLANNADADNWFLQLECFDPHEPFTAPERFRAAYQSGYEGKILDWPLYEQVSDSAQEIAEIRGNYAALVSMCDEYFGRLLDWMDDTDSWSNTALVLTTDHGFLLGEHEWWAKNKMPYYEEISHIPLMIWHPENASRSGCRVSDLSQTTDLMPTFLDFYTIPVPPEVTAFSMMDSLGGTVGQRKNAILGMFAGPVCVTDGDYSYYHYPHDPNKPAPPLYTVMPAHLEDMFSIEELKTAELVDPFTFTKGAPVLRMQVSPDVGETGVHCSSIWQGGASLYDLREDPGQLRPLDNKPITDHLIQIIGNEMRSHDAPMEIYSHYSLPEP